MAIDGTPILKKGVVGHRETCEEMCLLRTTPRCPHHGNWTVNSIKGYHHPGIGNTVGKLEDMYPTEAVLCSSWDPLAWGPPFWNLGHVEIPLVLFDILIHPPPSYQSIIHFSSTLLCLAPHSTHRDLFLRHRQMGSSLESCSKLEEGDCSFQERESFGSMEICSCFKPLSLRYISSSQIYYHNVEGLRMCRQLVSLGDNSILGKCPVSTGSGAKFQTPHVTDLMMDHFHTFYFLPPAFPCWPTSIFIGDFPKCN